MNLDSERRILIGHPLRPQIMSGHDYDVIVVGAGPVGGHLGRVLSERGLHVLLLEEQHFRLLSLTGGVWTQAPNWPPPSFLET